MLLIYSYTYYYILFSGKEAEINYLKIEYDKLHKQFEHNLEFSKNIMDSEFLFIAVLFKFFINMYFIYFRYK